MTVIRYYYAYVINSGVFCHSADVNSIFRNSVKVRLFRRGRSGISYLSESCRLGAGIDDITSITDSQSISSCRHRSIICGCDSKAEAICCQEVSIIYRLIHVENQLSIRRIVSVVESYAGCAVNKSIIEVVACCIVIVGNVGNIFGGSCHGAVQIVTYLHSYYVFIGIVSNTSKSRGGHFLYHIVVHSKVFSCISVSSQTKHIIGVSGICYCSCISA